MTLSIKLEAEVKRQLEEIANKMRLREIKAPLMILLEDAHAAEMLLERDDSQFSRRAYIRSIFAYIEGAIWILKQFCLKARATSGIRRISPAEYCLLIEETYELKSNGVPKTQTKFLRLPENIRFTFTLVNRLFGANLNLGIGTQSWNKFLQALNIRHRITHPKDTSAFAIADEEIELCKEVCSWFNELINEYFQVLVANANAARENA